MNFYSEHDMDTADRIANQRNDAPNFEFALDVVRELSDWTNRNSDGWAYWRKPANAAQQLIKHLQRFEKDWRSGGTPTDVTEAELKKALTPIKALLTRQGVSDADRARIITGGLA